MSEAPQRGLESLSLTLAGEVEEACCHFEAAWKADQRPRIEDYLNALPEPARLALLGELLALEVAYRWRAGENPKAEDYCDRFPTLEPARLAEAIAVRLGVTPEAMAGTKPTANDLAKASDSSAEPPTSETSRLSCPEHEDVVHTVIADASRATSYLDQPRQYQPSPSAQDEWATAVPPQAAGGEDASPAGSDRGQLDDPKGAESGAATPAFFPIPGRAGPVPSTLDPSPDRPPVITAGLPRIPGYEVLELLGRGGMGVVYKARHAKLNRVVALKMLRAGELAGTSELSRFQREAEALARSQHPNIVQIYEVGEQDGLPYFSLEFMEGGSLARKLHGTPLPPPQAALLVQQLARATHSAHQQGVVHRDLKPANVLLTTDGTPKIADFGLAKRLDIETGQTQSGAIIGTPSYMAPEQAEGKSNQIGPPADVYALGAILYELLTGRPPFKGPASLDTVWQVIYEEVVPPSRLQRKLPRDLETICLKCLQKEVPKRYASAQALAEDLQRFLAGEPIVARPVGALGRLWRWCRRNPARAFATGLAAVALGGVSLVSILLPLLVALRQEQKETKDALKEAKRLSANLALDRGLVLCENEEVSRGMLWMERSLKEAPEDAIQLRRAICTNLSGWRGQLHDLKAIFQHKDVVLAVAFSPDGNTVLTGCLDTTAQLWDVKTGTPRGPPLNHDDRVVAVAFSPKGKIVLTGSDDKKARLWQVSTGQRLGPPLQHKGAVLAVAFSPDGETVLTGSRDTTARLWEVKTGKPLGPPLEHGYKVRAVAFSPDGKTVLTGGDDGIVQLWDAATGKRLARILKKHSNSVSAAAFSPDGQTILTGSWDWTAQLWALRADKLEPLGLPLQHRDGLSAVAFSPDGKTVLTGSDDKMAQLWDVSTSKPQGPPVRHLGGVNAVVFSPDGQTLLTGSSHQARLWQVRTAGTARRTLQHQGPVRAVAFSPDGQTVLTGSYDDVAGSGQAQVWELAKGQRLLRLDPPHKDSVRAVAYSPDGNTALTGSYDKEVRLWQVGTGKALLTLAHPNAVRAIAFSPDGKTILTGSADHTARLWDAATGKLMAKYPHQHRNGVLAVAFGPDGKIFVTGSYDNNARLWDVATGKPLQPPLSHQGRVNAVAFSADGLTILTGSEDNTARLWDVTTRKPRGPPLEHQGAVNAVAFSPDGQTVLTGSGSKARLLEVGTGKPLGPPLQHQDMVWALAFSPDGKTILTGSQDQTARLWDAPVPVPDNVEWITLWIQELTGLDLGADEVVRELDAKTWQKRRRQLAELGKP